MNFLDKYEEYFNDFFNSFDENADYFQIFKSRMLKSQNLILFILLIFLIVYIIVGYHIIIC